MAKMKLNQYYIYTFGDLLENGENDMDILGWKSNVHNYYLLQRKE